MGEGGFRSLHLPAARCCAAALLLSYTPINEVSPRTTSLQCVAACRPGSALLALPGVPAVGWPWGIVSPLVFSTLAKLGNFSDGSRLCFRARRAT